MSVHITTQMLLIHVFDSVFTKEGTWRVSTLAPGCSSMASDSVYTLWASGSFPDYQGKFPPSPLGACRVLSDYPSNISSPSLVDAVSPSFGSTGTVYMLSPSHRYQRSLM